MTKTSKNKILATSAIIIVFFILAIAFFYFNKKENSPDSYGGSIDYSPPTQQEIQAGDEIKELQPDNIGSTENSENTPASEVTNAEVIITDANQYDEVIEVRAFMPNIIQEGECTITFSKDENTLAYKEAAYPDASSTICVSENIKRSDFTESGLWNITVSYLSNNYSGSKSTTIEIK